MSQIGGELLQNKLNSPIHQVKYEPGMYNELPPGALVIVDWRLEDQLRDATIRAVWCLQAYWSVDAVFVSFLYTKITLTCILCKLLYIPNVSIYVLHVILG